MGNVIVLQVYHVSELLFCIQSVKGVELEQLKVAEVHSNSVGVITVV